MVLANARFISLLLLALVAPPDVCLAATGRVDLGRLFTSPAQRDALNELRRQEQLTGANEVKSGAGATSATSPGQPADFAVVRVNGVVKRSHGEESVWINGRQVQGHQGPDDIRLYRGPDRHNRVLLGLPDKTLVKVKPGQSVEPESGKVVESYAAGQQDVTRP